MDIFKEII